MYGLMRARHCGQSVEQSERHRFHYCGTCKTIGRLYGQRSRLLLNHDTVFLAELLTLLLSEPAWENADKAYQSYNCLSLPKSEDSMPLTLQLAAAANILLVEFKVADRIKDAGQNRKDWRQGEFNALRAAFGWTTERLTVEQRGQAVESLLEVRCRIVSRISKLPFSILGLSLAGNAV